MEQRKKLRSKKGKSKMDEDREIEAFTIVHDEAIQHQNLLIRLQCPCCGKEFIALINHKDQKQELN